MNSVVAAVVALGAGSLVAAFLYFKRRTESPWDLILLRFSWIGLLVYALMAPPLKNESNKSLRPVLTIALDSSSSLAVSGDSLANAAVEKFEAIGYEPIIRDYNASLVPSNGDWAYVGDGHISNLAGQSLPKYYLLAPSKTLKPSNLIQGIVVPQRVLSNSNMSVTILASSSPEIKVFFNGTAYDGQNCNLRAPKKPGIYNLLAVATLGERMDSLSTIVDVKEYLATIVVASNAPHPHEAMVRRWCESKGIAVERIAWNELERVSSINGPLVSIGGGKVAMEKARANIKVPILHLDGGAAPGFTKRVSIPSILNFTSLEMYSKVNNVTILQADYLDTRGVHWYKSALASERTLEAFHALLEELMQRYEPAQLRLTTPQKLAVGESAQIVGAVVNSRLEVLPANFSIEVNQGATLVEEVTLSPEGNSVIGSFTPTVPGTYRVEAVANWSGGALKTTSSLQVKDVDVEKIRPRNQSLINSWANAGALDGATPLENVAPTVLSFEQKNPQHLHLWYWGLALLIASAEWIIRRRRGLV